MTEHDYADWQDNGIETAVKPKAEQYVYILLDTDFEEFYEVFSGVFATEEAANAEADRLCKYFYKDSPAQRRRHFKIRKEEVRN